MNEPELRCDQCTATFAPDPEQAAWLQRARAKGMRFVMLDCPHCLHGTGVDPSAGGAGPAPDPVPSLPCPTRACAGAACWVDTLRPPVWGCGSCGTTWPDRAALDATIDAAIARFPWRAAAYVCDAQGYRAADPPPAHQADNLAAEWAA